MTGTTTRTLDRQLTQYLFDDLTDSATSPYYIGVGRSEIWNDSDNPRQVYSTEREERNFRLGIQSLKRIVDYSFVVERNNWITGTIYSAYNDNTVGDPTSPYYVINDENQVYICLKQGKNAAGIPVVSTSRPTGTLTTPVLYSDGYVWKFLYSISVLEAGKFLSSAWMPVKLQDAIDSASTATEIEQWGIQQAAIPGQISDLILTDGGAGYTSNPTVTIVGDGDSAQGQAIVSGGQVVKVELSDSASTIFYGSGYSKANVVFSGGGSFSRTAAARPSLGPKNGFGADPRIDLRSKAIMMNVKPNGSENDTWLVGEDFRQIGVFRQLLQMDSADYMTDLAVDALYRLPLQGGATATDEFTVGSLITGSTSLAEAYIDKKFEDELWFHQTEETGFSNFIHGETITAPGGATGTIVAADSAGDTQVYIKPPVDMFSGELLFIENRAAVLRSNDQTEDLKVVIQM